MKLFSVHDKASSTYIPPFTMATTRDAQEGFRQVTNEKDTPYNKFPNDYTLVCLGEYDQRTGEISLYDQKEIITNASALLN